MPLQQPMLYGDRYWYLVSTATCRLEKPVINLQTQMGANLSCAQMLKVLAIDGILNSWAGWMTCLDFNLKLPLILAIPIYMCCVLDLICCSTFTVNEGEMSSIERSWESCPNLKRFWYELSRFNWLVFAKKKLRRPLPKCPAEKLVLR